MTLYRVRICKCGHEESFHTALGCSYGRGNLTAVEECACDRFRSRKSLGKRANPVPAPTTAIGALKAAAEFLALAISMFESAGPVTGHKRLDGPVTGHKRFKESFVNGGTVMTSEGESVVVVDPVTKQKLLAKSRQNNPPPGNGERKILISIAQHRNGVTREQISILTGYKTSTRNEYLSRLKKRGYVQDDSETFYVTDPGRIFLGDDFKPLPKGAKLREHWLQELPEGESTILEFICAAYPKRVSRETISKNTAYATSTRNEYISRLERRKLVVMSRGGEVFASKELFS